MLATLAFLYTIFGICFVLYFFILEPIGKGLKKIVEVDNQKLVENRRREAERKRKETLQQKPAYTKEYKEKTEEEFHRLRKRYLQFIKKSYVERGELEKWEQMMKLSDDILSKYDK